MAEFAHSRAEHLFDILVHVFILSLILQLLWMAKLRSLEKSSIKTQVAHALREAIGPVVGKSRSLPPRAFEFAKAWFKNPDDTESINDYVTQVNTVIVGSIGLLAVVFFLTVKYQCGAEDAQRAFWHVISANLALLVVVGAIEGYFCYKVILKYVPTKPSFLSQRAIQRLQSVAVVAANPGACTAAPIGSHWKKQNAIPRKGVEVKESKLQAALAESLHVPYATLEPFIDSLCATSYVRVGDDIYVPDVKDSTNWFWKACNNRLPFYLILLLYLGPMGALTGLNKATGYIQPDKGGLSKEALFHSGVNALWQGSLVAGVIGTLFFTVGQMQEELVLGSTIDRIVDDFAVKTYNALQVTDPIAAEVLIAEFARLKAPNLAAADAAVEKSNTSLKITALGIVLFAMGVAVVGSFFELMLYKVNVFSKNGRPDMQSMIFAVAVSALTAASCSCLAECNFMIQVASNNRPLSTSETVVAAIDVLEERLAKAPVPSKGASKKADFFYD